MDNIEQSSGTTFEEASRGFMDIAGEPGSIVHPVGVKLIPEGTRTTDEYQGVTWCEAVRIAAMDGEVVAINNENVDCPAAGIALGPGMPLPVFERMVSRRISVQGISVNRGKR